jgi:transcriptional regulator with XRE-family HTH domain
MHMAKVTTRFKPEPKYRLTFIRQWRKHRGYNLEQLAEMVGITHASLSRIERGLQPYGQALLEALAEALSTDVPPFSSAINRSRSLDNLGPAQAGDQAQAIRSSRRQRTDQAEDAA